VTRGSLVFTQTGEARFVPTTLAVLVAGTVSAISSPWGFLQYTSKDILTVMVPISGTVLALALPAAQLAQSVVENFLSSAGELSKNPIADVVQFLKGLAEQRRRDLSSMYCVIVYSLCSFLLGTAGFFVMLSNFALPGVINLSDWLACASVGFLIASVLWFLPVMRSSFDTRKVDKLIRMLESLANAAAARPSPQAPVAPQPAEPQR
jgi:hypothetical protein